MLPMSVNQTVGLRQEKRMRGMVSSTEPRSGVANKSLRGSPLDAAVSYALGGVLPQVKLRHEKSTRHPQPSRKASQTRVCAVPLLMLISRVNSDFLSLSLTYRRKQKKLPFFPYAYFRGIRLPK
jgi:hypothetical protein